MILIGQFDSPFVRRVAVALDLYGLTFEHRPWSVFGDAERIAAYNPLRRVPTLVLDDGEALLDSAAILDALDDQVGPERALIPSGGRDRRRVLRLCALAGGLADKAVSLVYERVLHQRQTPAWVERCRGQIDGVLDVLEAERAVTANGAGFSGGGLTHADIAVACALRFVIEAHPELQALQGRPALAAHSAWCEAMPAFIARSQAFHVAPPAN